MQQTDRGFVTWWMRKLGAIISGLIFTKCATAVEHLLDSSAQSVICLMPSHLKQRLLLAWTNRQTHAGNYELNYEQQGQYNDVLQTTLRENNVQHFCQSRSKRTLTKMWFYVPLDTK